MNRAQKAVSHAHSRRVGGNGLEMGQEGFSAWLRNLDPGWQWETNSLFLAGIASHCPLQNITPAKRSEREP